MDKLMKNKIVLITISIIFSLLFAYFFFRGLTMADPGTGNFAGISFSPKEIVIAGIFCSLFWIIGIATGQRKFKPGVLSQSFLVAGFIYLVAGSLIFSNLRDIHDLPSYRTTGLMIFISSAALPSVLYMFFTLVHKLKR